MSDRAAIAADCNDLIRLIVAARMIWRRAIQSGNSVMAAAAKRATDDLNEELTRRERDLMESVRAEMAREFDPNPDGTI